MFTKERRLDKVLVEAKVFSSLSQVRKNRPGLCRELIVPECLDIKVGKKRIYVVVGIERSKASEQSKPTEKEVQGAWNILCRWCRETECVFCFLRGHCGYDFREEEVNEDYDD